MRGDMRGCAAITESANVRLDFWARRSYFRCMNGFLVVPMQRRIVPAENPERGSAGSSAGPSARTSAGPSGSNRPRSPRSQTQRHLRASRFADIPAAHQCRCMNPELAPPASPMIASLSLDAFALASALATQRCGRRSRKGHPPGHPSGHLPGHPSDSPKGGFLAALGRLRAARFADIPTSPIDRCMSSERRSHLPSRQLLVPLALGTLAIASALAPQRFSAEPRRHRPGAAWGGAVGGPLVACLAMARRGEGCQQTRRPRGRACSARVVAVHRPEADLDRFVAALLALACEPGGRGQRRPGQPRRRTGESRPPEQSCRRR